MKWTKEKMRDYLQTAHSGALSRGILSIFALQTAVEQENKKTKDLNNRGFSVSTVKAGTKMAEYLLDGGPMVNPFWIDKARTLCMKHARQLAEIANGGELQMIRDNQFKVWGLWRD